MKISRFMFLGFLVLLVNLPVAPAHAGDLSAVINGKSIHVNSSYDWNEKNYGLGLQYQWESTSSWKKNCMVNGFRDSNDNMSYMAGVGLHRRLMHIQRFAGFYIDVGINAFLMTREDVNHNRPFPGVLPSVSFGNRYGGFNLTYLPGQAIEKMVSSEFVDPTISGIVFVQFRISLTQLLR